MKLLFDHNLSPRLVQRLADIYSDTNHVALVGLERASDADVWAYALTHGYIIVTKDSDFNDMSVVRGFPPKVIWLQIGNSSTRDIEARLRVSHSVIDHFADDKTFGMLVIV
jgi:predicted nuclease of predicted toxin-antitoxin system